MTDTPKEAARQLSRPMLDRGFKPVALHTYTDTEGNSLYWRIRAKHPDTGDKWIRPMRLNGQGYELAEPKFPDGKPLYALHRIASNADAVVWIFEGEQKADALNKLGLVATTSGSATSAAAADWQPLRGRTVRIWPDNDDPGKAYAGEVSSILLGLGCAVSCVDAAKLGLGIGDDVIQWLAAHPGAVGGDVEALPMLTPSQDKKNATTGDLDDWPDPMPLPDALPPVEPFDFDLLPNALRPWLQDIAERVQCPPDFPAVGAMISLAAVVGRKIGIRPKRRDDWLEVPNLWGAVIGRPGVMKSPALRESMRPLGRLEAKAREGFEEAAAQWRRAQELHKLKREADRSKIIKAYKDGEAVGADALADDNAEDEPQARRYVVNDTTVEALGEILQGNPNGTLAYRDELIGLLKQLDKEGNEGARSFFLQAWSGKDPYTFDRIGRGLNLRIDACCLSLLGSIQPSRIGGYLRQAVTGGAGDDGLIQRFGLLVWPDISGEWRDVDRWPDTEAKAGAYSTFERLDTLDPASIGATVENGGIPYLRFDAEAQGLFAEWRADFEHRIRSGNDHAAFESHLAKYRKLVPALALLIHLADDPASAIGETALLKALAWAEYLESHARRAYASVTQAEVESARALLHRIRRGEVSSPFAPRDVYLKHWACLSKPEEVHEAVRLLGDLDYLRKEEQATGGRPKGAIWINPKAKAA